MRPALILLVVAVACPGAPAQKREPTYKGKPLTLWVEMLRQARSEKDLEAAAEVIAKFGEDVGPAVPVLAEMLDDHSSEYRLVILRTLGELGPNARETTPQLLKLLKHKLALKPEQRRKEDGRYSRLESRPAYPSMLVEIRRSETEVLLETLALVAEAKDAVPVLAAALKDPELKTAAILSLCRVGPAAKDAIPQIGKAMAPVEQFSFWALSQMPEPGLHDLGPDVLALLLELVEAPSIAAKHYGLMEIVKLAPDKTRVLPRINPLLKDREPYSRLYAAEALWRLDKQKDVVPILAELLKEDSQELVRSAASLLGEIGPDAKEALPALRAAAEKWPIAPASASNSPFGGPLPVEREIPRVISIIEASSKE